MTPVFSEEITDTIGQIIKKTIRWRFRMIFARVGTQTTVHYGENNLLVSKWARDRALAVKLTNIWSDGFSTGGLACPGVGVGIPKSVAPFMRDEACEFLKSTSEFID
ncbi:hypothetical protein ACTXT7_008398 [Hymenolepis weldensis]